MSILKAKFSNGPEGCIIRLQSETLEELFKRASGNRDQRWNFLCSSFVVPTGDSRMEGGHARVKCWDAMGYLNSLIPQGRFNNGSALMDEQGKPSILPLLSKGLGGPDGVVITLPNVGYPTLKVYSSALGQVARAVCEATKACEIRLEIVKRPERVENVVIGG